MTNRLLLLALLAIACKDKPAHQPTPTPPPSDAASMPTPNSPPSDAAAIDEARPERTDMPVPNEIASLVKSNNRFAFELWPYAGTGNATISPASISIALSMAWAGAKGATAAEMSKTMHFERERDGLVWGRLSAALQDPSRTLKLAIANRIYGDAHYQFEPSFLATTREMFAAPLEAVDFRANPEGTRESINRWVAERTEQRIEDLLPPRSVDGDTRMVIVNALYFLADWANAFSKASTYDEPFHVDGTRPTNVPTMHRTARYKHAKSGGAALLELPYKDDSAAMYILLPDAVAGLPAIERNLAATFETLRGKLAETTVALSLPRFTVDPPAPIDLAKALQELGMKQAFDRNAADFTGIANPADPSDRLFIGAVLHKAFVKVDEKGTEAAAATAIAMPRGAGLPPKTTPFKVDRPFLFFIVERPTGLILFIGRVTEPKT